VLRSIHNAGIIHGDIRLSNLCISQSGDASIIDFGNARETKSTSARSEEMTELRALLNISAETHPVKTRHLKTVASLHRTRRNRGLGSIIGSERKRSSRLKRA